MVGSVIKYKHLLRRLALERKTRDNKATGETTDGKTIHSQTHHSLQNFTSVPSLIWVCPHAGFQPSTKKRER